MATHSRKNEETGPKGKLCLVVDVTGDGIKSNAIRNDTA